jgi:hypothetical protein
MDETQPDQEIALSVELPRVSDGALVEAAGIFPIGDNIYRPLLSGFREGEDARDVLSDAITWWDEQLAAVEFSTGDFARTLAISAGLPIFGLSLVRLAAGDPFNP